MKITTEGTPPQRQSPFAAGADLKTLHNHHFHVGAVKRVGTGLKLAIPDSHVGLVFARSSLFAKTGLQLTNSVGVIDSDYRGEIMIELKNESDKPTRIMAGDRIAQLVIVPIATPTFTQGDLDVTQRGDGGFGSTGNQ